MPRRTLKRSNKAKNKTRSRKQCGGGWGGFGGLFSPSGKSDKTDI